eukprot:g6976.t1
MFITIKTISGPSFQVEADESDTVDALKDKVVSCSEGSSFSKESLILIHKGNILKDSDILKDVGVLGSFCVAMTKKKPVSKGQSSTNPSPAPTPAPVSAPVQSQSSPPVEPTTETTTQTQTPSDYDNAASALVTGNQLEENINMICEMGFERDQVMRAMHAAFNNPDRAVEYLMNGIPSPQTAPQQTATGTPQAVGGTPVPVPNEGQGPNTQPLNMFGTQQSAAGGTGSLDFLRNNPQFQLIRQMVAQNPEVLQPMLQELGQSNPELLRQINEHQQEFLALLTEEPPAQVTEAAEGLMQLSGQGGVAGGDPVFPTVTITDEEAAAIDRLQSLGFDRDRCVEAYLICDKNEEIAANYLLEHADDS